MSRSRPFRTCLTLLVVATLGACADIDNDARANAFALTGGDARHGKSLIRHFGCGSCHTIPGVDGATASVGPPLTGMAGRAYIAGVLPNTPENLIRWVQAPQSVDPRTAMPAVGLSTKEAQDVAAYLYTLR
jgi:cytochrome c